jgi:2-dehydro-3-deoxyphosphogalactonate aldolase
MMPDFIPQVALDVALAEMPIVAILRGVTPDEVVGVAQAIYDAGVRIIEVPLNSPDPFASIARLAGHFGGNDVRRAIVGAGTVLTLDDVARCAAVGAQIIVSPNMNAGVIAATVAAGIISAPGCITPSEAFAALDAGAHAIKLFPGELITPAVIKAMRAVLPASAHVLVVGGVTVDAISDYVAAGASGFGIGGGIYRPGMSAAQAGKNATSFVAMAGKNLG